jgi:Tol biopolymer transport system component
MLTTIDADTGAIARWRVPATVRQRFVALDIRLQPQPLVWSADGRAVYFAGYSQELSTVWTMSLDETTHAVVDGPHRVTGMTESSSFSLASDGRSMVLDVHRLNARMWVFPLAKSGGVDGNATPITDEALNAFAPDLTVDGTQLLLGLERPGAERHVHEWVRRTLPDGDMQPFTKTEVGREWQWLPRWSPDATRISYRRELIESEEHHFSIEVQKVATGERSQLTSKVNDSPDNPFAWNHDGTAIITASNRFKAGGTIALMPLAGMPRAEERQQVLTRSDDHHFFNVSASRDDWIAFQAIKDFTSSVVVMGIGDRRWKPVTQGQFWDGNPKWSANGKLLYFLSQRGGLFNVWMTHIDQTTGISSGNPVQVTHFNGKGGVIPNDGEFAIGEGRLAIPVANPTGGLWIIDLSAR